MHTAFARFRPSGPLLAPLVGLALACSSSSPQVEKRNGSESSASDPGPAAVAKTPPAAPPATPRTANAVLVEGKQITLQDHRLEVISFMTAELPEGGGIAELKVKIDGTDYSFTSMPEGAEAKSVVWTDRLRVELASVNTGSRGGSFYVDEISKAEVPGSEKIVELLRRKRVALGDGWDIEFRHHSHKTVSPGQQSPLIVGLRYWNGENWLAESHSLYPPEDATWLWRNYRFELLDHEYDKQMKLRISRLELKEI